MEKEGKIQRERNLIGFLHCQRGEQPSSKSWFWRKIPVQSIIEQRKDYLDSDVLPCYTDFAINENDFQ